MNSDERLQMLKSRDYVVAKSNELVQKSRYDFSVNEQKTIAYICSMIKPIDAVDRAKGTPYQLEYKFEILDYIRVLGLERTGKVYEEVKANLKKIADKSMWLTQEDGSETLVRWLSRVTTNKRSGLATIKIDEVLAPYLFDLQNKYLSYGLKTILNMKSQYSIRLYEVLKSYYDMKIAQTDHRAKAEKGRSPKSVEWVWELDELKKFLMVENVKSYSNFKDFRRYVLEISQKEINELTDIDVEIEPIRKGRKTVGVRFIISGKCAIDRMITSALNDELLDN